MANLTLTIDDTLLKHARIRAIHENTSVNEEVRRFLAEWVSGEAGAREAALAVVALARSTVAGSGPEGRDWSREELYDR